MGLRRPAASLDAFFFLRMSKLQVTYRAVSDLIPYARNARTHSDEQVARIAASIKEFGWTNPILTDGANGIIAGHGRLAAARKLGMTEVPTIDLTGLSDAQKRAYILADNKLALDAGWDDEMLGVELSDLKDIGIDLSLTGFSDNELSELLKDTSAALPEEETEAPAVSQQPVVRRGDVFIMRRHRLMCGSSTSAEDVGKLLLNATPEILLTDPPYCSGGFQEVGRESGSIGTDAKSKWSGAACIERDNLSTRGYSSMMRAIFEAAPCLFAYVFTDWRMWSTLFDAAETSGFNVRNMIVWDKKTPGMGIGWRPQHELILWATKKKADFDMHKGYGNVPSVQRSGNQFHPTQKPEELIRQLIDNTTPFASGIFDPFGGSGTTLVAAEHFGQTCWLMELSPGYCEVIIKRWQELTGEMAYRESDGISFDELTDEQTGNTDRPGEG